MSAEGHGRGKAGQDAPDYRGDPEPVRVVWTIGANSTLIEMESTDDVVLALRALPEGAEVVLPARAHEIPAGSAVVRFTLAR